MCWSVSKQCEDITVDYRTLGVANRDLDTCGCILPDRSGCNTVVLGSRRQCKTKSSRTDSRDHPCSYCRKSSTQQAEADYAPSKSEGIRSLKRGERKFDGRKWVRRSKPGRLKSKGPRNHRSVALTDEGTDFNTPDPRSVVPWMEGPPTMPDVNVVSNDMPSLSTQQYTNTTGETIRRDDVPLPAPKPKAEHYKEHRDRDQSRRGTKTRKPAQDVRFADHVDICESMPLNVSDDTHDPPHSPNNQLPQLIVTRPSPDPEIRHL